MKYEITVRVAAEEKVIDIPWDDIKNDFVGFAGGIPDATLRRAFLSAFRIVTSRIRCVFLDRCKKSLIQ